MNKCKHEFTKHNDYREKIICVGQRRTVRVEVKKCKKCKLTEVKELETI